MSDAEGSLGSVDNLNCSCDFRITMKTGASSLKYFREFFLLVYCEGQCRNGPENSSGHSRVAPKEMKI